MRNTCGNILFKTSFSPSRRPWTGHGQGKWGLGQASASNRRGGKWKREGQGGGSTRRRYSCCLYSRSGSLGLNLSTGRTGSDSVRVFRGVWWQCREGAAPTVWVRFGSGAGEGSAGGLNNAEQLLQQQHHHQQQRRLRARVGRLRSSGDVVAWDVLETVLYTK
eukprot:g13216.t2